MGQTSIANITYIRSEKTIVWNEQVILKKEYLLALHPDIVVSEEHLLPLYDVLDMSYRPFSGGTGFLYIHTTTKLFAFEVTENPDSFIDAFYQIKSR